MGLMQGSAKKSQIQAILKKGLGLAYLNEAEYISTRVRVSLRVRVRASVRVGVRVRITDGLGSGLG